MMQSHVIEIDGSFVGAAVRQVGGYRFVAVDFRLEELDGSVWPTLGEVHAVARQWTLTGRLASPFSPASRDAAERRPRHRGTIGDAARLNDDFAP